MSNITSILILVILCTTSMNCLKEKYNILMLTSPIGDRGHSIFIEAIAKQLAQRGHQVTHRCIGKFEDVKGIRHHAFQSHYVENVNDIGTHLKAIDILVNDTYQDPILVDIVRQPLNPTTNRPKYDVVVVDELLGDIYLPLAHHMGVPNVLLAISLNQLSAVMWLLNVPLPWAYYNPLGYPEPMNLYQRTMSVLSNLETIFWLNVFRYPMIGAEIGKIMPKTPAISQLIRNCSFIMVNTHPPVQERLPTMPYKTEIACPQCAPSKSLPKNLEDIMESSGNDGVIYFSMGSFSNNEKLRKEYKSKIISALADLPQIVIWRDTEELTRVPPNFRPMKWVPQQDLLGHPKLRLMINNGGMMGMHEAAYHACPILGFPYHPDQYQAMEHAKRNGFTRFLEWTSVNPEKIRKTVLHMIKNNKYKEAAKEAAILMKDRPHPPTVVAAHWIEYVVRHEGASFLKSEAEHLYWFQYFMLDCIALLIVATILFFVLVGLCVKFTLRLIKYLVQKFLFPKQTLKEKKDN
ncbi:hypothetical protein CHUAL_008289 [Chamberlinius hualienensis]